MAELRQVPVEPLPHPQSAAFGTGKKFFQTFFNAYNYILGGSSRDYAKGVTTTEAVCCLTDVHLHSTLGHKSGILMVVHPLLSSLAGLCDNFTLPIMDRLNYLLQQNNYEYALGESESICSEWQHSQEEQT